MAIKKVEYEIDDYAERVRKALKRMEDTTTPGERSGKGGRMDVLRAVRADIQRLVDAGYTVGQITGAIAGGDVFAILPKSITQLLNERVGPAAAEARTKKAPSDEVFRKGTSKDADPVRKNKQKTNKDVDPAGANPSEEPNKTASDDPLPTAGGGTGPRPDRD